MSLSVESVGFWLSFSLIIGLSALEAFLSIIWTRIRVKALKSTTGGDGYELSIRVCGREVCNRLISPQDAAMINNETNRMYENWIPVGAQGAQRVIFQQRSADVIADRNGNLSMVPTLLIHRFSPMLSLDGAAGLTKHFIELLGGENDIKYYENVVHLVVGLVDVSLGIAGLVLVPSSPMKLWDTLQDVTTPMTLENYMTLSLLWWILGALLLVAMLLLRSETNSIQFAGCMGVVAYVIAAMADAVLFGLGCWKIDYARRNGYDWTPMLSYWIGGASAISLPFSCCGCDFEIFHVFGLVGLVYLLLDTF